jgi:prolyl 4-hydroxylase
VFKSVGTLKLTLGVNMNRFLHYALFFNCTLGCLLTAPVESTNLGSEKRPMYQDNDVEVLSWEPRVFMIDRFLSDDECDHLIALAKPKITRSLVLGDDSIADQLHPARTSKGMFFPASCRDVVVKNIERRLSLLTLLPEENCEQMQVLHYEEGGEYQPHYDYFDPSTVAGAHCCERGGQRYASIILYLADTEKGGETIFPKIDISVDPKKGSLLLFYDCLPNGETDDLTFHGGAPVLKGEKWIATKWIRMRKFI